MQLVVQALLGDLVLGDEAPAVPDRDGQRVIDPIGDAPALSLPGQGGQRRAIPVVGLDPPRPQLRAGAGGLRRCEQSHRPGEALIQLRDPDLMQATGGLDSDSGGTTAPASPVLNQTRLLTFPGSIATTSVDAGNASCSKPTTASPLLRKRHTDAPAGTGSTAISCTDQRRWSRTCDDGI